MEKAQKKNLLFPISILAFIGSCISLYQTHQFFQTRSGLASFHSFCNVGGAFDCATVEISKYAEFLPGFPLSAVAFAGYLVIAMLAIFSMGPAKENAKKLLTLFTGIALLFSIIYLILMIAVVGKLCLFCFTVDAINIALFSLALCLPKQSGVSESISFKKLAITGVSTLFLAFIFSNALNPEAEMKKEDVRALIDEVFVKAPYDFTIPSDAPVIGNPNAKITIVKFSDYQCPACKMGATSIHPLFKHYANDVKFVFINYPLDAKCNAIPQTMHEFACEAAYVAVCATEQGKFLEAYEALFENQENFGNGKIADLVAKVPGLDVEKLKACMNQPSTMEKIKRDTELGKKVNIGSTPTFFLNGKKIEGGLPTDIWIQIIDRMLKQTP